MRGARSQVFDVIVALLLTVVAMGSSGALSRWTHPDHPMDAVGFVLAAGTGLSLIFRRRWPLPSLAICAAFLATYLIIGYPYSLIFLPFVVAVYTAARYLPLAQAAPASFLVLLALLAHLFTNDAALNSFAGLGPATAWVVVPFALGTTIRIYRENQTRERAESLRQRVDDERLRVAQEVHDIVGHGLAAIKMQADVALHVLAKKPEQAQTALEAISRTSGDALEELRATLAVVRRTGDDDRSPTPSLSRLNGLLKRMDDAGVRIELSTSGDERPLPDLVDLTGYRIVQEALTNVLRHSGADRAKLGLTYETGAVTIVISNPVNGAPSPGSGSGIPGMRERVTSLGGTFAAGPDAEGFAVTATLPTGRNS
ncbi:sensor histidine kinase [Tenggerimyces flavus]|uniref:histidine kinase n=2 Tax=Tenggerimyces flavus TaxID=1708749 RepID=A0ABV7YDI0_9ACTN